MTQAIILVAAACALFVARPHRAPTTIGTVVILAVAELITGRMLGILSLPFALAAATAVGARRYIESTQGIVRSAVTATVLSFMVLFLSVVVSSYVYGRGLFVVRLALAFPSLTWWLVPGLCILILLVLSPSWRGTDNVPTA